MPALALDPDLVPPVAGGLLGAPARLVGARPGDGVVVRPAHADVVRLLTAATAQGPDGVVVVGSVWSRPAGRSVELGATLAGTVAAVADELARRPADLLVVPGAHPGTGDLLPLAELADLAHAHGAQVAVEAGPLVAAGAVDMTAAQLDHVVFSGLDVYAPLAAAVLVGGPRRQPDQIGACPPHPRRAVSAALAAACRELATLPEGLLAGHEADLRRLVVATLKDLPGIHPLTGWPDARRSCGLVSFTVEGHEASSVAERLAVRHGLPGVDTVLPPAAGQPAVRLRLGAAWAAEDVARLRDALEDVLTS